YANDPAQPRRVVAVASEGRINDPVHEEEASALRFELRGKDLGGVVRRCAVDEHREVRLLDARCDIDRVHIPTAGARGAAVEMSFYECVSNAGRLIDDGGAREADVGSHVSAGHFTIAERRAERARPLDGPLFRVESINLILRCGDEERSLPDQRLRV